MIIKKVKILPFLNKETKTFLYPQKCNHVNFTDKNCNICIRIFWQAIQSKSKAKYLRMTLNSMLNWQSQVKMKKKN